MSGTMERPLVHSGPLQQQIRAIWGSPGPPDWAFVRICEIQVIIHPQLHGFTDIRRRTLSHWGGGGGFRMQSQNGNLLSTVAGDFRAYNA